ncbi:glutaminase domain-containing protein [Kitasatospora sp. NBC_00315]|uniref:glutaminase family protein n=1 Tax=Kitasatospora sp. NBC_00315 TaxID=2975963 RepID=UPI003253095B
MTDRYEAASPSADPAAARQSEPRTPAPGSVSRRSLVRWSATAAVAAAGTSLLQSGTARADAPADGPADAPARGAADGRAAAFAPAFDPIRPPATPLAVRSPYLSTWLPADNLVGNWPTFWTGRTTAMAGLARIDGTPFIVMGNPQIPNRTLRGMAQRSLEITATRSTYVLEAGGVELTLTFLSPVEPGDPRRQSMPLSYLTVGARSTDGADHKVSVYFDISGEWAHAHDDTPIGWAQQQTGSVTSLAITPATPKVLQEVNDMAAWGSVVWSATNRTGMTWQTGPDKDVRAAAITTGALANSSDTRQPRAISDNWPVFAYNFDLGTVRRPIDPVVLSVGHVREIAINYLGQQLPALWKTYWPTWQQMTAFFHTDAQDAQRRTAAFDRKVRQEATDAGGAKYAALCALSLRQAYAGTELVSRGGAPWAFLKEISSDGNVSTIDVTYPAMPAFLYTDPAYLGYILEPSFDYPEHGGWPKTFAHHDLGSGYPNATGHNDGNEEDMPIEESANMLIMTAAYLDRIGAPARAFAAQHYPILKQWADYLVDNTLDPGFQNQTDDFTGFIGHSANLALKGITAVGAMSKIATLTGNSADAARYLAVAKDYAGQWVGKAQDAPADHLKLAYDQPGTWSLKYNGYPDTLLGLGLVPRTVAAEEAAWYLGQVNQYGVPLDVRHSYTKADWEIWTAAWLHDQPIRDYLVGAVYDFAHTSPSRAPFTDWYDTVSNRQSGFQARPVLGGIFALLTVQQNHQH